MSSNGSGDCGTCHYEAPAPDRRPWWERHAALLIALMVSLAGAAVSYGAAMGATTERLGALDGRVERVEARQAATDATIEKVRDTLILIGENVAATRGTVEGLAKQTERMERRIDSLVGTGDGGARRIP